MNPLSAIQVAVTRRGPRPRRGLHGYPMKSYRSIAMLMAYTINGARVQFQENVVGSIAEGKAADFVVLDRDLKALAPSDIHHRASALHFSSRGAAGLSRRCS